VEGRSSSSKTLVGGSCPHIVEHHFAEVMQRSAGSMAPNEDAPPHGARPIRPDGWLIGWGFDAIRR
jgi:hypothetical protein